MNDTLPPQDGARLHMHEGLTAVPGFRAMGVRAGLKSDRPDVGILLSDREGTTAAAVFTQNAYAAAPVHVARENVADGDIRAVVVNSGMANACTGLQGLRDARAMAKRTAERLGLHHRQVFVASTGLIGEPLPMEKVLAGIDACCERLGEAAGGEFETAILTTDSGPKTAHATLDVDGIAVHIGGAAKGAGMIHPNMATLLGFVATDAAIEALHLRASLRHVVDRTFNQISVDGDESTNDTVALLAGGASGVTLSPEHDAWPAFVAGLTTVCEALAKQIVADGEGATRIFEVHVRGAASDAEAQRASRAVAASNLVKCAIHGKDANWGRIISTIGATRVQVDPARTTVTIRAPAGAVDVLQDGTPTEAREAASKLLEAREVTLQITIGEGSGEARAWGCDLTNDYVSFNAHYTT